MIFLLHLNSKENHNKNEIKFYQRVQCILFENLRLNSVFFKGTIYKYFRKNNVVIFTLVILLFIMNPYERNTFMKIFKLIQT